MTNFVALCISLFLLLAAFPLISFGTERDLGIAWQFGLSLLVLGGGIPPLYRFVESWRTRSPTEENGK